MKSLLLVCLCWFPLEICPLAGRGNVGEGRASCREGRGRGAEERTGKQRCVGRTRRREPRHSGGRGKGTHQEQGRGEGSGKLGRKRTMGNRAEKPGRRSTRPGGRRRGGTGKWRAGGKERGRAAGAAAGGGSGRGLISISNGCEMRLAPLEAARV